MPERAPAQRDPKEAATVLEKAFLAGGKRDRAKDYTIADAAAASGLPLRDAEQGLHHLVSEYRGHLRVGEKGDLIFRFPNGLTKPWERREAFSALLHKVGRGLLGAGRFIVRAWLTIVLIGYVVIFLLLILGLTFARGEGSRDRGIGLDLFVVLFRVIADALFWTFHPFSPFAVTLPSEAVPSVGKRRRRRDKDGEDVPFYDKVNRFFFGPREPEPDPLAMEKLVVSEIRAKRGRIGLLDVIRVTGLPRDKADPLMARLMLDYDGEVEVSEEGGIHYRFEALRKTVEQAPPNMTESPGAPSIWEKKKELLPLTGNGGGTNFLIVALNAFNLLASAWVMQNHLTFQKISLMIQGAPAKVIRALPPEMPIALGLVPLVFSLALFALPIGRALIRPLRERANRRENGRRALLREVVERRDQGHSVTDKSLAAAWRDATGEEPDPKAITREMAALGGDLEIRDSGKTRYRFPDFELSQKALDVEREHAAEEEAKVGEVVFSSELDAPITEEPKGGPSR